MHALTRVSVRDCVRMQATVTNVGEVDVRQLNPLGC